MWRSPVCHLSKKKKSGCTLVYIFIAAIQTSPPSSTAMIHRCLASPLFVFVTVAVVVWAPGRPEITAWKLKENHMKEKFATIFGDLHKKKNAATFLVWNVIWYYYVLYVVINWIFDYWFDMRTHLITSTFHQIINSHSLTCNILHIFSILLRLLHIFSAIWCFWK